jgi:hypothetical protein
MTNITHYISFNLFKIYYFLSISAKQSIESNVKNHNDNEHQRFLYLLSLNSM